ncbi:MAG: YggS family pyridoxal phosphate-dependent enzyme [Bacteroidaceae bacterium]|nr:YggS family pyridoxal phosphate-dependent enzyme [Bacteroidaceae bacterium]
MANIGSKIGDVLKTLPETVRLVAISKYHPESAVQEAYEAGQRVFGESHVQELQRKHDSLPKDIEWHFIGHLQTNKVKYIAPYISLIHAVDTPKLLAEISKQGMKCGRRIPCLLQLHVAQEETKFGFSIEEAEAFLREGTWREMKGAEIRGVMCMASNVDDDEQIAREFETAHQFFLHAKEAYFGGKGQEATFCECSWGMSDDYEIAIQHGSTMVRVGSRIFGEREYK